VRKVDLAVELQILSYHEQRRVRVGSGGQLHALPGERGQGASA
jgi:redox-sensing transcriptional repressor